MNKKAIITRIGDLLDNNCGPCPKNKSRDIEEHKKVCGDCEVFKELQQLGHKLDTDGDGEKAKRILAKGEDMTTSEIMYLLEMGVLKTKIRSALKMSQMEFYHFIKELNAQKKLKKRVKKCLQLRKSQR